MKCKITSIFFVLVISFTVVSCKKYLDKPQNENFAVPTTLAHLQSLLDYKESMNEYSTPSMLEASADDYFLLSADYNAIATSHSRIAPYTWDADRFDRDNDWKKCYYPVYVANLCIEQGDKIERTFSNAAEWDNVRGSAYFFRAYYFLELLWNYAKAYDASTASTDPGIAVRLISDINEPTSRASVSDSYKQVIADAKVAAEMLPDRSIHPLRPSRAAAYGLLARVYLSMRDYDSAFNYSNKSLQIYHELMNYNSDPDIVAGFGSTTPPFRKYNKETVFFTGINTFSTSYLPTNGARIDSTLYASYNTNDLRKLAFFNLIGNYYAFKGSYVSDPSGQFSGIATDELFLIRAECKARLGDKDGALIDLNQLLINRYKSGFFTPVTAANAQQALAIILTERRKELLMRGLRWNDLKRFNKEGANITITRIVNGQTFTLPPNDPRYAQLIPQEIIELTGMPQNSR